MRKQLSVILSLLVLLSMLVGACAAPPAAAPAQGGAAGAAAGTATEEATGEAAAVQAPPGATRIAFWHSMGGDVGGISIPKLADDFNASQTNCFVEPTYQGSYDDSLNKLRAGLQSNDIPALVQLFDIATKLMVDLKVAKPVQDFMDAENFDTSDFEPNVLAYYTIDGKQYSMPFNTSTPLLYYNKDMFKAAGLDPEKPPRTFDEVAQYAEKLTQRDDSGNVTVTGGAFAVYGWFVEQLLAVSGALYADNGNGRDAAATEAIFNSPEGVRILQWWKDMYDSGSFGNYGRTTVDTRNAFLAGQTAMFIDSTAVLRGMIEGSDGKFELGTGWLPRPDEAAFDNAGTVVGGASLWILNGRPQEEQECAWQFVKFLTEPAQQAYWHTQSGYFPIRKAGYDEPLAVEWRTKYPQFQTAVDQLHAAPNNRVTQGALIGVFPTARQTVETAIEEVLAGQASPQQALDNAAATVTQAIDDYNATMGQQ
ncbi:MAG: ABC transporter substrate-binding protein [Caldilineaceae bacterium]